MSPRDLNTQVVVRRLVLIDNLLQTLSTLADDPDRLRDDPVALLAVERILTQLVDLASDVNAHIVSARLRRAPGTSRDSFELLARADVISTELANELGPSVGLLNVLVHEYADIDPNLVRRAVPLALDVYRRYVRAVRDWILAL